MYTIDISDAPKGSYTKTKKVLDNNTVDWSYSKPVFRFECDETTLSEVSSDLAEFAPGIEVHDDSATAELAATSSEKAETGASSTPSRPRSPSSSSGEWLVSCITSKGGAIAFRVSGKCPDAADVAASRDVVSVSVMTPDHKIASSWP
jgi:hypothetical protein